MHFQNILPLIDMVMLIFIISGLVSLMLTLRLLVLRTAWWNKKSAILFDAKITILRWFKLDNYQKIVGLSDVTVFAYKNLMSEPGPDPQLVMGVELEIEYASTSMNIDGFKVEQDGSLRNSGLEFISKPMLYSSLVTGLITFFSKNKLTPENYSNRTSIHVHANCMDFTPRQLATLLMLYQIFEPLLFQFVGEDRDKNIFCVPLSECVISYAACEALADGSNNVIGRWPKYTAFNLAPIGRQGTVEFRHMPGTCDMQKITQWLRLISRLFFMARHRDYDDVKHMVINLNTTSQYRNICEIVFETDSNCLLVGDYERKLEDGVLAMKYSLMGYVKPVVKAPVQKLQPDVLVYDNLNLREALDQLQNNLAPGGRMFYVNEVRANAGAAVVGGVHVAPRQRRQAVIEPRVAPVNPAIDFDFEEENV